MKLTEHGGIYCNKSGCHSKMDLDVEKCPECGNVKCYIVLYWEGETYTYRRDDDGKVFRCFSAVQKLTEINKAIQNKRRPFKPQEWIDTQRRDRIFEIQWQEYMDEKEAEREAGELSPEYFRTLKSYNKNHFEDWRGWDVKTIDRAAIASFKQKLSSRVAKIKTRKNILNALHAFFAWLYDNGRIEIIPAFPIIKGDNSTPRRAIRPGVQDAALQKLPTPFRDPIEFMMKTGLRPGECVAVLVKSVDIPNRVVWVERALSGSTYVETTKNKSKLPIPLNDRALEIVRRNIKGKFPNDFLFTNPKTGRGYARKRLWAEWKRHSGTDVKLYEATRHSYCTQIVPLTDPLTAQRLMRHKDRRSTDNYYHAYSEVLLDVVQRMDNVVDIKARQKGKEKAKKTNAKT
jgi:integrase